jgi:hypothetical protein
VVESYETETGKLIVTADFLLETTVENKVVWEIPKHSITSIDSTSEGVAINYQCEGETIERLRQGLGLGLGLGFM